MRYINLIRSTIHLVSESNDNTNDEHCHLCHAKYIQKSYKKITEKMEVNFSILWMPSSVIEKFPVKAAATDTGYLRRKNRFPYQGIQQT